MSLTKGTVSLTRYRVMDNPPEVTDEFIAERLRRNALLEIDGTPEEESYGWVEVLDMLARDFPDVAFHFGPVLIFGFRVDTRKLSPKVVNRYVAQAEAQSETSLGRPLSAEQRRQLKNQVRFDLLTRTPVTTDVFEVCWFPKQEEVWLAGGGAKNRQRFEDLWRRTFNLGLLMKIPFILARELLPASLSGEALDRARPSALLGGRG